MGNIDFAPIMRDCMLPIAGYGTGDQWERAFEEDESTLTLLPRLAAVSKEWSAVVKGLPQYAVVRIATADFNGVKPREVFRAGLRSKKRDMTWIFARYEEACHLLSQSWTLEVDVYVRLRTVALGDLNAAELQVLISKFKRGWGAKKLETAAGETLIPNPRIWITPGVRAA